MAASRGNDEEAFRRFLRRVWQHDINPLLRGQYAAQRRTTARVGGKIAASAGLLVDGILRLRGKPFTRFMTVFGSSMGALLPDVWDWSWLRDRAAQTQRKVVEEQVQRRAAELPESEALALFRLAPSATREELKAAWRGVSQRWHPDKAPDDRRRAEYHVRFVAYQAAYRRLCGAYDDGKLPKRVANRE